MIRSTYIVITCVDYCLTTGTSGLYGAQVRASGADLGVFWSAFLDPAFVKWGRADENLHTIVETLVLVLRKFLLLLSPRCWLYFDFGNLFN